ncbi:MAG: hypothetical protein QXW80_06370 [Candidatus Micrarchaeia archaeon]
MTTTEELVLSGLESGVHLVESLNTITVFGVGLWTWLIVFFVADFVIGVIFWFLAVRRSSGGGDE